MNMPPLIFMHEHNLPPDPEPGDAAATMLGILLIVLGIVTTALVVGSIWALA